MRRGACFWILLCLYPFLVIVVAWNFCSAPEQMSVSPLQLDVYRLSQMVPTVGTLEPAELRQAFGHAATEDMYNAMQTRWLREILKGLFKEGEILECAEDASLLEERDSTQQIFIAVNLYNCESMMPNFILQLLRFVSLHKHEQIRISVYESGSSDSTPEWLLLFQKLLDVLSVKNRIVVHGDLVRSKDVERIQLLAQLRNAAMAPLHEWKTWKATKVVFINDVFFCAQHIVRLLMHDADVACGMDFAFCVGCLPRMLQKKLMQKDLMENYHVPQLLAAYIPRVKSILKNWRYQLPLEKKWSLGVPMVFYDRWVTHDLNGHNFLNAPPYAEDAVTSAFLFHGYPVYVHSCWNGLVAINAEPFYMSKSACIFCKSEICCFRFEVSASVPRGVSSFRVLHSLP